jgi:Uma2 family endonuclease
VVTPKPGVKYTYQDYLNTCDDVRYELIDGDLILAPAPTTPHQRVLLNLAVSLASFVRDNGLGEVFVAPTDVYLSDTNVVQPGLLFVAAARAGIVTEPNIHGAPDLVVEVASPSTEQRDLSVKLELYARFGVPEYWTAHPTNGTLERRTLEGGQFVVARAYGRSDVVTSPLFPGLQIDLGQVF